MKNSKIESVVVVGLGYIGLPTAAVLASRGVSVIGVDVNQHAVDTINRGEIHIVEPDLDVVVERTVKEGFLRAQVTTPYAKNYIVAVPTPFKDNHEADLTYIEAAADAIAPQLSGDELIVLESTSPPGATEHMANRILKSRPDLSLDGIKGPSIHIAHCPERVLPGRVMIEMITNDRIVGGLTEEASKRAQDLYSVFCEGEILITDAKTAEMTKLVENSFRDVNIAFANELSIISENLGINVWELIRLANHHPRVNILQPGPGVGGHCIAVDPWFIVAADPINSQLIKTARQVNDSKPQYVIDAVGKLIKKAPDRPITTFGLSFKPDIDDLRESPALNIVQKMAQSWPTREFNVVEPNISELPVSLQTLHNVKLVELDDLSSDEHIAVLLVDHTVFKEVDPQEIGIHPEYLVDARGVWV